MTLFPGESELAQLMRGLDWTKTPLGAPESWPQGLKTAVHIMLTSRQPFWLGWGPELTYLYNDPYKSIIGGKHPRALGRPFREVWSEIWDVVGPMADTVMQRDQGTYVEAQLLIMERHGYQEETYYTFSYSPIPDDAGGPGGLICANTDDTRRVIGERQVATLRELAARTAKARSHAEACALGVEALETNARDLPFAVICVDEKVAGTAGIDAAQAAALPLAAGAAEVLDADPAWGPLPSGAWPRPPTRIARIPIAPAGGAGLAGVLLVGLNPFRKYDDSYRGFLELAAGQIAAALANAQAYEEERRRAETLAELDRAKTAFFSNVSHEFRTPLTLMLGPLNDLLERGDAPERETLSVVQRNGQRLLKLVNTLLDFARIEAGRVQASYEETDLARLSAELASNFRSACERAGLRLEVDCPPAAEPAYVDREMWEKIVLNLLSNAFKFTHHGSISLSLRLEGDFRLTVRDTGTGIPAAELPRMFERFHRVEGARGRSHEGSGIGLALVQELVRLHGGTIGVESEPGRGSVFTVRIPAGAAHLPAERMKAPREAASTSLRAGAYVDEALSWLPAPASAGLAPAQAGAHSTGKRILLADDNADLREYARRLLAEEYQVEAVADGNAALAAARARAPDLIVSDVMMPGLDGFGLIRELRADARLREVPVVLLSARAGEEARIEGLGRGADDYLTKPFSARELLVRVGALLRSAEIRREAAAALRESESRFRTLADTAPAMLWITDPDGHCTFLSRGWYEFTGQTEKQALGLGWTEAVHPEDRAEAGRIFLAANQRREAFALDYRLRRSDGEYRWSIDTGRPRFGPQGEFLGFIGSVIDVHERKKVEQTLHEEARTLETLNRIGRTLAGELDLEKTVQAVTEAGTELSGAKFGAFFYNVKNAAGESYMLYSLSGAPREAFEKFGMPRNTAVFAPTFGGEGVVRIDDVTRDPRYGRSAPHHGMPKGHLPVRSYLAASVVSRSGEVLGGLFFGHPQPGVFTERAERLVAGIAAQAAIAIDNARLYAESRRLVGELREADRRKDEFIATLSHELRNPLAPLANSLELLGLTGGAAQSAQLHDMMRRQVTHLVRLTDDLLEISRVTRGAFELRRERVELAAVVRNALEASDPLIRAGGRRLELELPPEPLWLDGDPVRLAQILANLLNNSARYTDAAGRIELRAWREEGQAVVAVHDNGAGIAAEAPAEELPRVFDMFSRGERSSGLGIGLALARRLAEMHGGTISAASAGPGRGAEFSVRLPLAAASTAASGAASGPAAAEAPPLAHKRVLVVDDNRDAAESLGMLLKFLGAEVEVAHGGRDALAAFETRRPAVVLLDIGMPEMDGYQVARAIRERENGTRVPLVALTGWGQEEDLRRAREAGFDHHMIKPPDIDALRSLLGSVP